MRAHDEFASTVRPAATRQGPTTGADPAGATVGVGSALTPVADLHFQRTAGNAVVAQLLEDYADADRSPSRSTT